FQPVTPTGVHQVDRFDRLWDAIGQGGAQGPGFTNNVSNDTLLDLGAGLEWTAFRVPVGTPTTVSAYVGFGPVPSLTIPAAPLPGPPAVPEASPFLLFGGGGAGLAGYFLSRRR